MRFLSINRCLSNAGKGRVGPLLCSRYAFSTFIRQTARHSSKSSKSRTASSKLDHATRVEPQSSSNPATRQDAKSAYAAFRRVIISHLENILKTKAYYERANEYRSFGINSRLDFDREAKMFRLAIERACTLAGEKHAVSQKDNPLFFSLRSAFVAGDVKELQVELVYAFRSFLMRSRFPNDILATHLKITDLRYPSEWYPATRALKRTIHLHVGPTNSGKTYNALKALENAKTGIYAGPLRLLAHEVYSRFLAKGKSCALLTGEEQRIPTDTDIYYKSCTVEMTPLNQLVDVAVIDEIQMMGDIGRGWAWTQALLGVQAKEVHLCGEERAIELVQTLCSILGDECIVHRYKRLNGLETMHESLEGNLENLQKGDAIVSFSRLSIHSLKQQVEQATGKSCAIVYGSLPPETRAQQAALFNDPDNDYDYLVASDAIGMGLNLNIRRVIFEATHKHDNNSYRQITVSEAKQIGGRAGRFKTAHQAIQAGSSGGAATDGNPREDDPPPAGLVTALEDPDLAVVIRAFEAEPEPLKTAYITPPAAMLERLSSYFPPNTPFSYIIVRFRDIARLSPGFSLSGLKELLDVADLIQPFPMTIYDRCVFLNAPVALRDEEMPQVLQALAKRVSQMEGGELLDIQEINLEVLDIPESQWKEGPIEYLTQLERLHKSITLYLWLSYRFTGVFKSQALAFHVKKLVETNINKVLTQSRESDDSRRRRLERGRRAAENILRRKEEILEEELDEESVGPSGTDIWSEENEQLPLSDSPSALEELPLAPPESRTEPETGR
ncbi:P-loop containing nucleoside triphosphate hydrolase protein [Poronia punctata]|nr:P-loop containing nucleoside triphosphate hydrolase protein [Poronia punctata]